MIVLTSSCLRQNTRDGPGETNVVKPNGVEEVLGYDAGVPQVEPGRNVLTFPTEWNANPMFDFPDDGPGNEDETDGGTDDDADHSDSSVSQPESDEEEGSPSADSREAPVSARNDTGAIAPCEPGAVTERYSLGSSGPVDRADVIALAVSTVQMPDDASLVIVPKNYAEAMSTSEAERWFDAMDDDMNSIESKGTFEWVARPRDRKVVGVHWVYALKLDAAGRIQRYKGRVVAKGYAQVEGLDYNET
jgi:hypothetical protein